MSRQVLVVTGSLEERTLEARHVDAVRCHLKQPGDVRWLAEGAAFEVPCDGPLYPPDESDEWRCDPGCSGMQFDADFNFVPKRDREKKILVADMESTIIVQECLDELAAYVGRREEVSAITARAMAGELDFEAALRERVMLLKGMREDVLRELYSSTITLMPGADVLVATMRARGAYCALVSGGFTWFTARIAARLGFHDHRANVLEIEDDALTGSVRPPILGRAAKKDALKEICGHQNLPLNKALAVGDGANDLDMLTAAGFGVAFRAKPLVRAAAPQRVQFGDLRALLFLQGYTEKDFVLETRT